MLRCGNSCGHVIHNPNDFLAIGVTPIELGPSSSRGGGQSPAASVPLPLPRPRERGSRSRRRRHHWTVLDIHSATRFERPHALRDYGLGLARRHVRARGPLQGRHERGRGQTARRRRHPIRYLQRSRLW